MNRACLAVLATALIVLVAGCATPHRTPSTATERPPGSHFNTQLLGFEGVYDQARQAGQTSGLELAIEFHSGGIAGAEDNSQALLLRQRDVQGNERPFVLAWQATDEDPLHQAYFAPLDSRDGQARGRCPLTARLTQAGLSAETEVENCRFGEGSSQTALHKEIALDGTQLVIADRVLSLEDTTPLQDDVVLRLFRRQRFEWRAIDRSDGGQRLAAPGVIDTAGHAIALSDAAGMALPFRLQLRYYQLGRSETVVLRLSILDETGDVVAESWGDHESTALGIATDTIEVALQRTR